MSPSDPPVETWQEHAAGATAGSLAEGFRFECIIAQRKVQPVILEGAEGQVGHRAFLNGVVELVR